jgi:Domain of unknown function (DUF4349)
MPATEPIDFEREFSELVRELRALPTAAPAEVRERVRALGEPEARRLVRLPRLSRRTFLVLAPVCLLALLAASVVVGVLSRSSTRQTAVGQVAVVHGAVKGPSAAGSPTFEQSLNSGTLRAAPAPSPGRYQDYQAYLRLRVGSFDSLGRRTADAMQVVRSLGGFVASVDQTTTSGQPGSAVLVLRVPVANVQTALIRLSALGTVLDQHVSITDLNAVVRAQRERILQLKLEIARITAALEQPLPADVRVRLELQLDTARRSLQQATGSNAATLRTAALSRIELTMTTQKAAAVVHRRGSFGRAVHAALGFLAGAGMVGLVALIVLGPFVVLAALAVLGARAYRRREERRLLAAS